MQFSKSSFMFTALLVLALGLFSQPIKVSFSVPYTATGTKTLTVNGRQVSVPYTISGKRTITTYITLPALIAANTINLQATPSPFTMYLRWDSVPGCPEYAVYRNDTLLTVINGLDTWDAMLRPNVTYRYAVKPLNLVASEITATTTNAPIVNTAMVADREELTSIGVAANGIVTGYAFAPDDVGKCISIKNGRAAKWYREAPLWWHGYIQTVNNNGSAVVSSPIYGNPLPLGGLTISASGYFGTNNYDTYFAEINDTTARQINLSGHYLIDPFRSDSFLNARGDYGNRTQVPYLNNRALFLNGGNLYFGEEDAIGTSLYAGPGYIWHEFPLTAIEHGSGIFCLKTNIYGPKTEWTTNRESYPKSWFYKADVSNTPKQVFYTGSFGDSSDYRNGFFFGFEMKGPTVAGGKSVLAMLNAKINNPWPFGLGVTGQNPEVGIYNKSYRWLLRNTVINGSGRATASNPVNATVTSFNDTYAILQVDSTTAPTFTFWNLAYWEDNSVLMKRPDAYAGGGNAFTNVVWRPGIVPLSAYSCLIPKASTGRTNEHLVQAPLLYGNVVCNSTHEMQPSIGIEGHVIYINVAEVEVYNTLVKNYNTAFLRQNGADGLTGSYRQWSIVNLSNIPPLQVNPWYERLRSMGYYLQYSTAQAPPLIQFQPMGFVGQRLLK